MAKVNIISIKHVTSSDPARVGRQDTLVRYGIEGVGTDFVILAGDDLSENDIVQAITAKVATPHPAHGKSFEV